jgi:tol-pal system protein YbgF
MWKPFQSTGKSIKLYLLALALLSAGCAAPQPPTDLQQRVDELLNIQQQQTLRLTELTRQVALLQSQPARLTEKTGETGTEIPAPLPETSPAEQQRQLPPRVVSSAETAEISAAAELYLEAFAAIATGQMPEAESSFKKFVQRYPDHEYLGNANFWLAESLLAQHKTKEGETLLLAIIDQPQQQNKAPAAMARLVKFYRESGSEDNASAMLQMLNNYYPESPELKRLRHSPAAR